MRRAGACAACFAYFVRIVGQQHVAGRQIGGVLVEDVAGKFPTQQPEAGHFRPSAIGDKQRVGTDVERRRCAKLAAP